MFLPIKMTLRPSRQLLLIVTVLRGLALWAVSLTALSVTLKGIFVVALVFSVVWQGWRYWHADAGRRIGGVRVDAKNVLWLEGLGEESHQAELKNAWLGPGFGVATVSSKGHIHRVLWMPDSADKEGLRRWRVWLRWKGA
jgi:Membrane-bound toxin component of toxin-antitoxin system